MVKSTNENKKKEKKLKIKKEKILRVPKSKLPSYSAEKVVAQLAREQGALVREVETKELVRDDRSLFFNEEFKREENRDRGWLLK